MTCAPRPTQPERRPDARAANLLQARIDEGYYDGRDPFAPGWDSAWVLAECDAKWRIIAAYLPPGDDPHPGLPCINYEGQDPNGYDEYDTCHRHLQASKTPALG